MLELQLFRIKWKYHLIIDFYMKRAILYFWIILVYLPLKCLYKLLETPISLFLIM